MQSWVHNLYRWRVSVNNSKIFLLVVFMQNSNICIESNNISDALRDSAVSCLICIRGVFCIYSRFIIQCTKEQSNNNTTEFKFSLQFYVTENCSAVGKYEACVDNNVHNVMFICSKLQTAALHEHLVLFLHTFVRGRAAR